MESREQLRPIGQVLRILRVCRSTLWNWEQRGIVVPYRDSRGHRYYDDTQIEALRQRLQPRRPEAA